MVKRFLVTGGAVLAAIVLGAALAVVPRIDSLAAPPQYQIEKEMPPAPEDLSSSPEASSPSGGYLLGAYNGRVSVLSPETGEPEMIFDIFLRTLPEMDQQLLQEGILVETYEELTRLIEDYIS